MAPRNISGLGKVLRTIDFPGIKKMWKISFWSTIQPESLGKFRETPQGPVWTIYRQFTANLSPIWTRCHSIRDRRCQRPYLQRCTSSSGRTAPPMLACDKSVVHWRYIATKSIPDGMRHCGMRHWDGIADIFAAVPIYLRCTADPEEAIHG